MICKRRKVVKIEQRTLASISLVLVICLPLCAQDQRGIDIGQELSSQHTSESNAVVELPEISTPEVRNSLENSIAEMQAAVRDAKAFVTRQGSARKKSHFWNIEEQVVSEGKTIMRCVHFLSEKGPIVYAYRCVFEGEGASRKEIKDQSYTLYFYPDGRVERFTTRGSPRKFLHFYLSGRIKQYDLVENKEPIVAVGWKEDGKAKYEKYKKPKP